MELIYGIVGGAIFFGLLFLLPRLLRPRPALNTRAEAEARAEAERLQGEVRELQEKLRREIEARSRVETSDEGSEAFRDELLRKDEVIRQLDQQLREMNDHVTVMRADLSSSQDAARQAQEAARAAQEAAANAPVQTVTVADEFAEARLQNLQRQVAEKEEALGRQLEERERFYKEQLQAKDDFLRQQLNDKDEYLRRTLADREEAFRRQVADKDTMIATLLQDKEKSLGELRGLLAEADRKMTDTFEVLSTRAVMKVTDELERQTREKFEKVNEEVKFELGFRPEAIGSLLQPFEDTMKVLERRFKESDEKRASAERVLEDHMNRLMGVTGSLSHALRGPGMRGNWTELTLKTVLDNAGLVEGQDYELPQPDPAKPNELLADAVIRLPKGRSIVIDTKAPVELYREAMNAIEERTKEDLLSQYAKGVRSHVMALSARGYWQRYEGADYVLMFLPAEGMYQAAVDLDPALVNDSIQNNVILANPMTLVAALRSVAYVLDQERLNINAHEIREVGERVHDSIKTYAVQVAKLGRRLRDTVEAYNESVGSLERNVFVNTRALSGKGVGDGQMPEVLSIDHTTSNFQHSELPAPERAESDAASGRMS
ncbi:MAG: DNA recombination protein RmuC [Fimbriimonas sp.]